MESPIRRGEQEENDQPEPELTENGPVEESLEEGNQPVPEETDGGTTNEQSQAEDWQPEIEPSWDEGMEEQVLDETAPGNTETTVVEDFPEVSSTDASSEYDSSEVFSSVDVSPLDETIPESPSIEDPDLDVTTPELLTAESSAPDEFIPGAEEQTFTVTEVQAVEPALALKKVALILSGGGARGAFQVGAEMYARQVKGYQWDIIAGVSVGALNGAMLAMHRYHRLLEIWDHISNDQVYTGGFTLPSLIKIIFGAKSFYSNEPLQRLMKQEFDAGKIIDDLHVGAVSLVSGEYVQFTKEFFELTSAILASSAIPVIWTPVDVSPDHTAMVDGGVRNISPIGDILDLEPDEIVIINCGREEPGMLNEAPANVLSIGMRTLDILMNEVFVNDIKAFLRINDLVKEAQDNGVVLHHPKSGRALKYYPYVLIEPDEDLGETLDFTQGAVQKSLRAGVRRAREVLGRP